MAELLLELFSEEIPARMQARAAEDLKRLVIDKLKEARLSFSSADAYVTPRRLALVVDGLPTSQPDLSEERKGPRVGAPEQAIQGFLKAAGLTSLAEAEKRMVGNAEFWFAVRKVAGRKTAEVLPGLIVAAIHELPWPKSQRWANNNFRWVRPLHGVLALFDGKRLEGALALGGSEARASVSGSASGPRAVSVSGSALGPRAVSVSGSASGPRAVSVSGSASQPRASLPFGDETRGHRFLAPNPFAVTSFADYKEKLRAAFVMLDREERKRVIAAEAAALAAAESLTVKDDPALLEEVCGLVEWPVPLIGSIDTKFMDVPREVLTSTMRANQKYFTLETSDGKLAPRFVVVANMSAKDGGKAIVAGNERVLRARLSDAKFFWDLDRKTKLEERVPKLDTLVFHAKLGTVGEKVGRLQVLAAELTAHVPGANVDKVRSAALLCKADLVSGMVGEFPELQGIMGRYYALQEGEDSAVADAIAEHYSPKGPDDRCPTAPVSIAVALADKIDTLVGFWSIDEKPTGSKDPYALRRAALGVIRLIVENRLRVPLRTVFRKSHMLHGEIAAGSLTSVEFDSDDLLAFFADRLKVHLREQGVRHDLVSAVFALGGEDDLVRLLARVEALAKFLASEDGANLLTAYKRATNIVRIEEKKDTATYDGEADGTLLAQPEEKALFEGLKRSAKEISAAVSREEFAGAMAALARLRPPVDDFFDKVTVNCDDPKLRRNRLKLLSGIRSALGGVADFSKIEG